MRLPLILLILAACVPSLARAQAEADTARFAGVPSGAAVVAERLPTLDAVLADDPPGRSYLRAYARRALYPQTIQTAAHLEEVFALRDSVIAHLDPRVEDFFVEDDDYSDDYSLVERFLAEATLAGLEPLTAEGFVLGVGPGELLPERVEALGAPDFQLYARFQTAHARSLGGEYPFADMEPLRQVVLLGERLCTDHPGSPYTAAVGEDFEQALLTFMSLHRYADDWLVGPATTDFYPWASSDEAHHQLLVEDAASRYHPIVAALLAEPSEASSDTLDAVVVATGTDEAMRRHVLGALDASLDVLDVLPLDAGWTRFGAVYRYFPQGDARAARAAEAARAKGLAAEVMTIPVPYPYEE